MRPALFLSALLATALFGGTALAERTNDDSSSQHSSTAQNLKERVLQERGQNRTAEHSSRSTATRAERPSSKVEHFRTKGENYEQFGRSSHSGGGSSAASHGSSGSKMMASKLFPGRSHGEVIDGNARSSAPASKGTRATVGSTLATWTPGGKNVRSFTHSVNDKGETNNQIHGNTASAMKMRKMAKIIMKTAVHNPHIKLFEWSTAGGDGQSLFPGN